MANAGSPAAARRFAQAHHIVWWRHGGATDLDNLVLVCFFHHRLVHEHGWKIERDPDGIVRWLRADGRPHETSALAQAGPKAS